MNQTTESKPYPPLTDTIIFFLKFVLAASFLLALAFLVTNYFTVEGYYNEFEPFFVETILAYILALVLTIIGTIVLSILGPGILNIPVEKKKKFTVQSFMAIGFLSFFLLAIFQYFYQVANYPLVQDPYPLTGFAWQAVLFWWIASIALGVWGILSIIIDRVYR